MKSSPPDRSFAGFVRRALASLRAEVPWAHAGVAHALAPASTTVVVDGEPATLRNDRTELYVDATFDASAGSRCVTTSRVLLDLVAGRDTLIGAIETDRVHLSGSAEALLGWFDALEYFLHGAVRAHGFDTLLDEFKARADPPGER